MEALQGQRRKQSTGTTLFLLLLVLMILALLISRSRPMPAEPRDKMIRPVNALWRTKHPAMKEEAPIVYLRSV